MKMNRPPHPRGERVVIKAGILKGAEAEVVRKSGQTGSLTLKLTKDFGPAWKAGDEINIMPHDVEVANAQG